VSKAGIGFDTAENEVSIVTRSGTHEVPRSLKTEVARAIIEVVEELRAEEVKTS
jgi:phosphopantothenoylcysteine synthetase/decarboxylase